MGSKILLLFIIVPPSYRCSSSQAHNIEEGHRSREKPIIQSGEKKTANPSKLHSNRLHAPAVVTLIHYAGVQHDSIFSGRRHGTAVGLTDFAHRSHLISSCTQLGGQHNLVSYLQGVVFSEVLVTPRLCPAKATVPSQILVSVSVRHPWPGCCFRCPDRSLPSANGRIFSVPRDPPE